jgi:hypothetical protein
VIYAGGVLALEVSMDTREAAGRAMVDHFECPPIENISLARLAVKSIAFIGGVLVIVGLGIAWFMVPG